MTNLKNFSGKIKKVTEAINKKKKEDNNCFLTRCRVVRSLKGVCKVVFCLKWRILCFRHELNEHVDSLQYDLDGLRDILSSNQYSIDPSFLLGVSLQIICVLEG